MIAFRNVMNSSLMRWLSQEVAFCVVGVGQCASLKERKWRSQSKNKEKVEVSISKESKEKVEISQEK